MSLAFFDDDDEALQNLGIAPAATGLLNEDQQTFLENEDGTTLQPE